MGFVIPPFYFLGFEILFSENKNDMMKVLWKEKI
jgi:hypothetical protein